MRAFSLVELSIVLVILGLLTGGILTGQSLIRAAELRSVTSDFVRYRTAIYSFRDRYTGLPGDITNATRFWTSAGGDGQNLACFQAQAASSQATCNGNGNGTIDTANVTAFAERFSIWKHLANAGLVEGNYTGRTAGAMGGYSAVINSNVPAAKISPAFFDITIEQYIATDTSNFALGEQFNAINIFGSLTGGGPVFLPEEAWNIDTKLDDGRPAQGFVLSTKRSASDAPNCTTSDALDAAYDLTVKSKNCILRMRL